MFRFRFPHSWYYESNKQTNKKQTNKTKQANEQTSEHPNDDSIKIKK